MRIIVEVVWESKVKESVSSDLNGVLVDFISSMGDPRWPIIINFYANKSLSEEAMWISGSHFN